ncbi:MAG: preprotein translocase subunit SecE [Ancrocorticia sp.]
MNDAASAQNAKKKPVADKQGLFARIALFFRQVLGELKKVQRPSRQELGQMFLTVILFVIVIMAFVGILDFVFSQITLWIFG